jgi:hypothetical protein
MRIKTNKEEEWGLPCGIGWPIVMCKLCDWEIRGPVPLFLIGDESNGRFQPLVGSFRLSIGSGVICRRWGVFDPRDFTCRLHEFGHESWVSVADNFSW